jgi:hypothetical protein
MLPEYVVPSLSVSMLFGARPARRTAQLDPIEALRFDQPSPECGSQRLVCNVHPELFGPMIVFLEICAQSEFFAAGPLPGKHESSLASH